MFHRKDGPAIEWSDGGKEWWLNGQRHRKDGPAIEWASGDKEWWIDGDQYTEEKFLELTKKTTSSCDGKVVEIDGEKYKLVKIKKETSNG